MFRPKGDRLSHLDDKLDNGQKRMAPRYLAYKQRNPSEGNMLVCSDVDGGSYELITFSLTDASGSVTDSKRRLCLGPAVFLGRNRFAVFD